MVQFMWTQFLRTILLRNTVSGTIQFLINIYRNILVFRLPRFAYYLFCIFWSGTMNNVLIQLYEMKPLLWNPKDRFHYIKTKKQNTLNEKSEKLTYFWFLNDGAPNIFFYFPFLKRLCVRPFVFITTRDISILVKHKHRNLTK